MRGNNFGRHKEQAATVLPVSGWGPRMLDVHQENVSCHSSLLNVNEKPVYDELIREPSSVLHINTKLFRSLNTHWLFQECKSSALLVSDFALIWFTALCPLHGLRPFSLGLLSVLGFNSILLLSAFSQQKATLESPQQSLKVSLERIKACDG